jgi:hypothetical protein
MHKKTDTIELDFPKDDIDCWEKYTKHRWVYDLSRLLDAQSIKWSPYEIDGLSDKELNIVLQTTKDVASEPGFIYTKKPSGRHLYTEVYITKGEIKLMRHIDSKTGTELPNIIGELELRINAFVTLYFQKFTGVISLETFATEIFRVRLRPYTSPVTETNVEIIKLLKRIYKKTDITINGPSDQVLHETLAS